MHDNRPERRIMVAMPSYDGRMDVNTHFSVMNFHYECSKRGWGFGHRIEAHVAPISVARSKICVHFLESTATDLFFLDADVSCDNRAMVRMVDHPVDLVLGVYPERHMDTKYRVRILESGMARDPETGLIEVAGGPAGFMRVRRHVIEKMLDNLDHDDWFVVPNEDICIPMIFKPLHGRKFTCSEDMYFCRRWTELGGKVWMDPDLNLDHSGRASFASNFYKDWLLPNKLVKELA